MAHDALKLMVKTTADVPTTLQERFASSSIWYTPTALAFLSFKVLP